MEIEDAGPNPDRLAAAIHRQLGHKSGAVPVGAVAEALDIVKIRQRMTGCCMGRDSASGAIGPPRQQLNAPAALQIP